MSESQLSILHWLAAIAAVMGVGELSLGIAMARAPTPKILPGYILQGSGVGWLLAGPVFYLAWNFVQTLIVGLLFVGLGANLGVFGGLKAIKARRGEISP